MQKKSGLTQSLPGTRIPPEITQNVGADVLIHPYNANKKPAGAAGWFFRFC